MTFYKNLLINYYEKNKFILIFIFYFISINLYVIDKIYAYTIKIYV